MQNPPPGKGPEQVLENWASLFDYLVGDGE
jgi:hypothetical protein